MKTPAESPSAGSALARVSAAIAAYLLYAILTLTLVETWVMGSALRWLVTVAGLTYAACTYLVWKRIGDASKAWLSTLLLLLLLVLSAWRLGSAGADGGLTVLRVPAATLATLVVVAAMVMATYLLSTVRFLSGLRRFGLLLFSLYCLLPLVIGLTRGQGFDAVLGDATGVRWFPRWLRGTVLGAYILLPLGLLTAIARLVGVWRSRSWTDARPYGLASVAIVLSILLTVPDGARYARPGLAADPATVSRSSLATPIYGDPKTAASARLQPARKPAVSTEDLAKRVETLVSKVPGLRYDIDARARVLGSGIEPAFLFVRDQIRFEAYPGVLRGASGTYTARAGNAFDRSLLLAEFLKRKDVPVRFALGRLPRPRAEQLFARIFEPSRSAEPGGALVLGSPPPGAEEFIARLRARATRDYAAVRVALGATLPAQASPTRDEVLPEIESHVWIQAQVGAQWQDLDSAFADAVPGRAYATVEQTVDALPPEVHQRVTMRVVVEGLTGGALRTETPLEVTLAAEALHHRQVFLVHVPLTKDLAGAIAGAITSQEGGETWVPAFWIDGETRTGSPLVFNDQQQKPSERGGPPSGGLKGIFGPGGALASGRLFVAEWLEIEIAFPGGRRDMSRRALVDRAGAAWRASGKLDPAALRPLIRDQKGMTAPRAVHNIWFSAGRHNLADHADALRLLADLASAPRLSDPPKDVPVGQLLWPLAMQNLPLLILSDHLIVPALNDGPGYRFYADAPRVFIVSVGPDPTAGPDGLFILHDLRRDRLRGLARESTFGVRVIERKIWFGVLEGALEHEMAAQYAAAAGDPPSSVTSTSALLTNEGAVAILPGGSSSTGQMPANRETAAQIERALSGGRVVVVPKAVLRGGASGWWEIGRDGGDTRSVMDGDINPSRFGGSGRGFGGRSNYVDPRTYSSRPPSRPGNPNRPNGTRGNQGRGGLEYVAIAVAIVAAIVSATLVLDWIAYHTIGIGGNFLGALFSALAGD